MSHHPQTPSSSRTLLPWRRAASLAAVAALSVGLAPSAAIALPDSAFGPVATARQALPEPTVEAPTPDVLDVDASRGFEDAAAGRTSTVFGTTPEVAKDPALGRNVFDFTGKNSVRYDFADGFDATSKALTLECTVRFDAGLNGGDGEGAGNFCGAKEAGGFSLTAYGDTLKMMVNVDGQYYGAGTTITEGVWYHAVGVWDGSTVSLHLNGKKVAEEKTSGAAIKPPKEVSRKFFLGADVNNAGEDQFNSDSRVANAGVFSRALSPEEITARYVKAFADRTQDEVSFALTSPSADEVLTRPTNLAGTITHEELLAGDLSFTLDGKPVALGDIVGPGLRAGEHTIAYQGFDALGEELSGTVTFTSTSIPRGDGVADQTGEGRAQLTARATNPSGNALTTTFLEADVALAAKGTLGWIDWASVNLEEGIPADVTLQDAQDVTDGLKPTDGASLTAPATDQIPALHTEVAFSQVGQTLMWEGQVDPAREVRLLALNTETNRYEELASSRGSADRMIQLTAPAQAHHNSGGVVKLLVIGIDPFSDDLENPIRDSFEDPSTYDFAIMHITDTQYLSEGATKSKTEAERQEWAAAYQDSYRWLADNKDSRKIAFVAHTGDIIENWIGEKSDREQALREYEFASETQKMLEETGVPNMAVAGNHDNQSGKDNSTESLYNTYFGPKRYEAQAASEAWKQAGAEYEPWKPGDNENGYTLFSAGGQDFVAVHLGYDVQEEEADWAASVLQRFSTRNGIVLTHAHRTPSKAADGRGGTFSHDGEIISTRVLETCPNAALVLAGHEHGVSIAVRNDVGQTGNHTVELLADYQFYEISAEKLGLVEAGGYAPDKGLRFGSAYFRLLQFDLKRGEVAVDTYSAYFDDFGAGEHDTNQRYDGREDDTRLPVQFQGRTTSFTTDTLVGLTPSDRVISEVTHDSGEGARAQWDGLKAGTVYGWFAVSRDVSRAGDAAGARAMAMAPTVPAPYEGIVQVSSFTATGKPQDDEPGAPGDDPKPGDDGGKPGEDGEKPGDDGEKPGAPGQNAPGQDGPGNASDTPGSRDPLARTGVGALPWAAAAVGLMAGGGLLLLRRRGLI